MVTLHQPFGLLEHHTRHLHVPVGGFVEGGADHLGLRATGLHVGDFFRPLVDEQDDERDLGMILDDRVGELLQQDRLATLGRGHDEGALSLAEGRDDVADAGRDFAVLPFEANALVGVLGRQVIESASQFRLLGVTTVDALHFEKREVPFPFLGRPDFAHHRVTGAEVEALDLGGGDVDVVGAVQVIEVLGAQKAVAFGQDFEDTLAIERRIRFEQRLLDAEDELLLAKARDAGELQGFCERQEFRNRLSLQLGDVH